MTELHALPHLEILLRLFTAFVCGAAIGLNREFHRKPAGFRTFGLIAIGSALVVIVMEHEFGAGPDAVSRVIQGVLTGVGFLGAGVIFRRAPSKVAGLTTAAAVWLTAGLGMAAGAGQYFVALTAAGMGLLLLLLGGPFERRLFPGKKKPRPGTPEDEPPP